MGATSNISKAEIAIGGLVGMVGIKSVVVSEPSTFFVGFNTHPNTDAYDSYIKSDWRPDFKCKTKDTGMYKAIIRERKTKKIPHMVDGNWTMKEVDFIEEKSTIASD